jgi:nucleotide-binding universal stress UspA family protein
MLAPESRSSMRIVLGVDGSEHSLAAARLLRDLPLPAGSVIDALAVLTQRQTPGRAILADALEKAGAILQGSPAEVKIGILHGHPAEALSSFADQCRPDLIVAGAVGLRATLGILLGGVAQQLVEYAHWPVLVVRAPYAGLQRLVLVIDGSPQAARALEYLTRLPLPAGTDVHVLQVIPPIDLTVPIHLESVTMLPMPVEPSPAQELMAAEQAAREESEAEASLAQAAARLQAAGLPATTAVRRGDAATEIMAYARALDANLIVAGSRGLSAIAGWLLGSVSRKLVHYAACSVLLVKPERTEGTG